MASPLNITGLSSTTGRPTSYQVIDGKAVKSLFGNSQFSPFPADASPSNGNVTRMGKPGDIHSDNSNAISIPEIVEYCKQHPGMKLDYADFAYLKNVGVYPNNRLVIARRFSSGVGNDLTLPSMQSPLSTLISWVGENDNFIELQYGEVWTAAEGTFEEVLNNIGEDMKAAQDITKPDLGNLVYTAFSILPLPGFMEGLQYQVLNNLGLTDAGVGNSPLGNPNLIREAQRRTTVEPKRAGSGLMARFSIKMEVEYEQKFINGVDPTLVYLDIIQNALTFGTSDAFFQYSSAFGTGVTGFMRDLISGDIGAVAKAIGSFITALVTAIGQVALKFAQVIVDGLKSAAAAANAATSGSTASSTPAIPSAEAIVGKLQELFRSTIGHVISKYKVRLIGIVNAVTGGPSTPWHVTIGNPKKPIFSSGDMFTTDVTITLGKTLAFNDLPSSIKISFTLTNARPLGAQEIFNRFNTGKGRSYAKFRKSFNEAGAFDFGSQSDFENVYAAQNQTRTETTKVKVDEKPDDYIVKGDTGTEWLSFSDILGLSDPNNTSGSSVSNISNQNTSSANNLTGVNITGGSPSTTQGAANTTGASPSNSNSAAPIIGANATNVNTNIDQLTTNQIKNEQDRLALERTEIDAQLENTPESINDAKIYLADGKTITVSDYFGDVTETKEYKENSANIVSLQTQSFANPKYNELIDKKNEIERKIIDLQNKKP
jgi:hypothetical protein